MQTYHLEWSTSAADSQTGDQIQVFVDSYAFIERGYVIEFDFGVGG
jgi:hypothetical protein